MTYLRASPQGRWHSGSARRPTPERPGDLARGLFLTPGNFYTTNSNANGGMRIPKVTEQ